MTRRGAMATGVLVVGGASLGLALRRLRFGRRARLGEDLSRRFTFPAGAVALGRAYLEQTKARAPAERDPAALLELGEPDLDWGRIRRLVGADIDADRVIVLRGWVLSRTEARLYALMAYLADGA